MHLSQVVNLSGRVLKDYRNEAELIKDIVGDVLNFLNRKRLSTSVYIVGIDSKVRDINYWLHDGSSTKKVLLLYGIAGTGKTTIAQVVYNMSFQNFEASSFIADIGSVGNDSKGLICAQKQLLRDITARKYKVGNAAVGMTEIQRAVSCRRVLIVLDDVTGEHVDVLSAMANSLRAGSKMIITSRHKIPVKPIENVWMKEILPLGLDDSLKLFSWHAFEQENPEEGYSEYSNFVVNYCGGLPLALKVFGSYLSSNKTQDFWRSALEDLKVADSDQRIGKLLRHCYNSLPHQSDKDIFLDIICFHSGTKVGRISKVLESCGYKAVKCRLQNLENRCLITIDKKEILRVHQLLQDMGKEVIYEKSPDEPWRRSRLWGKNAYEVVKLRMGTEKIEGMSLKLPTEDKQFETRISVQHQDDKGVLEAVAFAKMPRLKFLELVNVKLKGRYKRFAENLKWLSWHEYTEQSLPNDLNLENLVGLDLRNSYLEQVWKVTKVIENLKILNLKNCRYLIKTPNFSGLPSLEEISLENCISLIEVHESIGDLKRLVYLNFKNCTRLESFPRSFSKLQSLKQLILQGCERLGHGSEEDPPLPYFSPSIFPQSLVELNLCSANISSDQIPDDLSGFCSLTILRLSNNPITNLPESIIGLKKLEILELATCVELESLPPLPLNLKVLSVLESWKLKKITCGPSSLNVLTGYITRKIKLERSCDLGLFKYCDFIGFDFYINLVETMSDTNSLQICAAENYISEQSKMNTEDYVEYLALQAQWAQIVHSEKISFMFLPGSRALECFQEVRCVNHWDEEFISEIFHVPQPPYPECKIWGCSISIKFQQQRHLLEITLPISSDLCIQAKNLTTDSIWALLPSDGATIHAYFMYEIDSEAEWVSVWHSENFFREGDDIQVSFKLGENFEAKAIGIQFLYADKEGGPPKESFDSTINAGRNMGNDEDIEIRTSILVPPDNQSNTYRDLYLRDLPYY